MCIAVQGPFVAGFAQSNEGDVSPNTKGPHCIDTGLPCDFNHSTCDGKVCANQEGGSSTYDSVVHKCFVQNEKCIAFGPGKDMFDSTRIIGEKQYTLGKVTRACSVL